MTEVVVLGGGLAGLSTALITARAGHRVSLIERDPTIPPTDPEDAWSEWERRGVSQFRMPHFMLAAWTQLMRAELPDVLDEVLAAGGRAINPLDHVLPRHSGGHRDGDKRFASTAARRPVLESVVGRAAAAQPGLRIHRGETVRRLLTDGTAQQRITGVVTRSGDTVPCDVLVDASGRRSALPDLLAAARLPTPIEERAESGFVYLSRHFRCRPGGQTPAVVAAFVQDYPELTILTLPADNDTWSVTFVLSSRDQQLRAMRDERAWSAALALFPLAAHWADAEPLGGVAPIAGIEDRIRDYAPAGRPVVGGLVAVGDSWASTNPTLGRGTSMALRHAVLLREVLAGTDDPWQLGLEWDRRTRAELEPLYRSTAAYDRNRLAAVEAHRLGQPYDGGEAEWRATALLAAAARHHPEALRGTLEVTGFLATATEVSARPGMAELLADAGPARDLPGPDRAGLLAAVAG